MNVNKILIILGVLIFSLVLVLFLTRDDDQEEGRYESNEWSGVKKEGGLQDSTNVANIEGEEKVKSGNLTNNNINLGVVFDVESGIEVPLEKVILDDLNLVHEHLEIVVPSEEEKRNAKRHYKFKKRVANWELKGAGRIRPKALAGLGLFTPDVDGDWKLLVGEDLISAYQQSIEVVSRNEEAILALKEIFRGLERGDAPQLDSVNKANSFLRSSSVESDFTRGHVDELRKFFNNHNFRDPSILSYEEVEDDGDFVLKVDTLVFNKSGEYVDQYFFVFRNGDWSMIFY